MPISDGNPANSTPAQTAPAASSAGNIDINMLASAFETAIRRTTPAPSQSQSSGPKQSHYEKLIANFKANPEQYQDPFEWDRLKYEAQKKDIQEETEISVRQSMAQQKTQSDLQMVYSIADKILKNHPELADEREDIVQSVTRRFTSDPAHAAANQRYQQGLLDIAYIENMITARVDKLTGHARKATGASGVTRQDAMSEQGAISGGVQHEAHGTIRRADLKGKELEMYDAAIGIFQRTNTDGKDSPEAIAFASKKIQLVRNATNKSR